MTAPTSVPKPAPGAAPTAAGAGGARPFSVIIPAHNEAKVIGRCLSALLKDAPHGALDILVVCNGCTDDTAARAAAFGPDVRVIALDRGSKPLALNAGNAAARHVPRFFVDADIVVGYRDLAAAALVLETGPALAAAPALAMDTSGSGWALRAFYRIWMQVPYVREDLVGAGIYGLSAPGLARLGAFPDIIADDMLVYGLFAPGERVRVAADAQGRETVYTAFPPKTLRSLIDIEVRRLAGRVELADVRPGLRTDTGRRLPGFVHLAFNPLNWPALTVYAYVKIASWLAYRAARAKGRHLVWRRDESSRGPA